MKYILVICDMRVFVLKPLLFGAMRWSVIVGGFAGVIYILQTYDLLCLPSMLCYQLTLCILEPLT